jgi:protein PhnA
MSLNTDCPKCGSESAYHNGICYVCPDCGFEWDDGIEFEDHENSEY